MTAKVLLNTSRSRDEYFPMTHIVAACVAEVQARFPDGFEQGRGTDETQSHYPLLPKQYRQVDFFVSDRLDIIAGLLDEVEEADVLLVAERNVKALVVNHCSCTVSGEWTP